MNVSRTRRTAPGGLNTRRDQLLQAPIVPTLLRLATPNILNLAALAGLIAFDGLFVGRLGTEALTGISLVFPWVMLVQHAAASGVGGAVSSAIARALGEGNQQRADHLATHAVWLALLLGALFASVMLLFGPMLYEAMGGRGQALAIAIAYSTVAFSGIVAVWMLNLLGSVLRGTGEMTLPALVIAGTVLLHVVLSPLLIFGAALGVRGAAWGLVCSFGAGSAVLAWKLRRGTWPVQLRLSGVPFQWRLIREFLRVGVPGLLNVAITNLTVVALTALAARIGPEAAIAYALGARLEYIVIPIGFGIGTGIVAMVGTNWGARQHARAFAVAWAGASLAAVACGAVGIFFALFPRLWMGIFTTDEAVIRLGASYLAIVGPCYAFYGFGIGLYFACQGLARLVPAVAANAARLLIAWCGGTVAVVMMDGSAAALYASIAAGFAAYAGLTALVVLRFGRAGRRAS